MIDPATAAAAGLPVGRADPVGHAGRPGRRRRPGLPGDVVTAVGSTAIDATHPLDPTVLGLAPGQQVTLTVYSNGTSKTLQLTVGSG